MTNNKNNDGLILDGFFDDDPTDELPIPVLSDSADASDDTANSLAPGSQAIDFEAFDDDSPTGTGITALEPDTQYRDSTVPHLEAEIQQLRGRWQEIENKLDRRDTRIQTLEDELVQRTNACEELECDLQAVAAERASIESAAADLKLELKRRDIDIEEFSDHAEASRLALEEQLCAVDELQTELDEHRNAADERQKNIESAHLQNALEELAMLTGYIDGRKGDWYQSEQNRIQQHETIDALELSLTNTESLLVQKEKEKQALALRIIDFQHRLTGLEDQETGYRCKNDELLLQLEKNTLLLKQQQAMEDSFEQQCAQLQIQLTSLESEHEASLENVRQLEEQVSTLLAQASTKDKTIDSLKNELQAGQQSLQTVLDEVGRLGSVNDSIHDFGDQMSQQLSDENSDGESSATCLMVATDGDHEMKHPLYKDVITIGRSQHSDIQIRTQYVSRDHAHILTDDLGTFIEDLGSKNGIRVNSIQVEKRRLKHGDRVDIGEAHFKFIDLMDQNASQR